MIHSTIAAKIGALALAPFLMFGGHGNFSANANDNHGAQVSADAHAAAAERFDSRFGDTADANANDTTKITSDAECTQLTHALYWGTTDSMSGGDVSKLQTYLHAEGYLDNEPSGWFGLATLHAVQRFQADYGISATGFVGAQTRAKIELLSCADADHHLTITNIDGPTGIGVNKEGTWTVNVEDKGDGSLSYAVTWGDENTGLAARAMTAALVQSSAAFTHTYSAEGTYHPTFTVKDGAGHEVSESVSVHVGLGNDIHVNAIDPAYGAVGTNVTITGNGFMAAASPDTTVRVVGGDAVASINVHSDSELSFAVPDLSAGIHYFRVENANGVSNVVAFKVTAPAETRLSVNGVDAPVALSVNEEGTWTVHVDSANVEGNLHYAASWGDEGMMARMFGASSADVQSSSSFTHSYSKAGAYMPKFTVSDDYGHSASVSASVKVTND